MCIRDRMNTVHPVGDKVHNLFHRVGHTGVGKGGGVVLKPVEHLYIFFGQACTAVGYNALNLLFVQYRHNSRLNGHGNAVIARLVQHGVEIVVVKKQLADKVGGACLHLSFQITHILVQITAFRVRLRIAGSGEMEPAFFVQVGD